MIEVGVEQAYDEACRALGEEIVRARLLGREVQRLAVENQRLVAENQRRNTPAAVPEKVHCSWCPARVDPAQAGTHADWHRANGHHARTCDGDPCTCGTTALEQAHEQRRQTPEGAADPL